MKQKDYTLRVRMSPEEQARAQRLAAATDLSVSEVVRRLLSEARIVVRPPVIEADPVTYREMIPA